MDCNFLMHLKIHIIFLIHSAHLQYPPFYPQPFYYLPPALPYPQPQVHMGVMDPIPVTPTDRWATSATTEATTAEPPETDLVAMPVMFSMPMPNPAYCLVKPRPPFCPPCPVCVCVVPCVPVIPACYSYNPCNNCNSPYG